MNTAVIQINSPLQVEQQQEALLLAKYGGLKPKKHLLAKRSSRKCFDSAEWAMAKEGKAIEDLIPDETPIDQLPAKLEPSPTPPKRRSTLDGHIG